MRDVCIITQRKIRQSPIIEWHGNIRILAGIKDDSCVWVARTTEKSDCLIEILHGKFADTQAQNKKTE